MNVEFFEDSRPDFDFLARNDVAMFQNANFEYGFTNWTIEGKAGAEKGYGYVKGGHLFEGLWLKKGSHTFTTETIGQGVLFVRDAAVNKIVARSKIRSINWCRKSLTIQVDADGTFYLGIMGKDARIKDARLNLLP